MSYYLQKTIALLYNTPSPQDETMYRAQGHAPHKLGGELDEILLGQRL